MGLCASSSAAPTTLGSARTVLVSPRSRNADPSDPSSRTGVGSASPEPPLPAVHGGDASLAKQSDGPSETDLHSGVGKQSKKTHSDVFECYIEG